MPRRIDHRATAPVAADELAAVMLDADYLRARLAELGGPGAELLEHGDGRYRIRHGVDESVLPQLVRNLVGGPLVIERTESLRRTGENAWSGRTDVAIPGTPASATGSMSVTGGPASSVFAVEATVTVAVPFLGGRIETTIAEQVKQLLDAETTFTLEWLKK
jgi:hypothetical protein